MRIVKYKEFEDGHYFKLAFMEDYDGPFPTTEIAGAAALYYFDTLLEFFASLTPRDPVSTYNKRDCDPSDSCGT
jgi:hypothetical protein